MSTDSALVVIDVQVGLIEPSYRSTEVLENIRTLLEQAHAPIHLSSTSSTMSLRGMVWRSVLPHGRSIRQLGPGREIFQG
jgi:nicotinamidase-related amidase